MSKLNVIIDKRTMRLTVLCINLLSILNFLTLGFFRKRLLIAGNKVVDLFIETIELK